MAHEISVPRLGWSMEEGIFIRWLKRDGDFVRRGEALFELEGEKALQEIESLDDGILRIPPDAPKEGSVVPVGQLLGYLAAEGESISDSALTTTPLPQATTVAPEISANDQKPASGEQVTDEAARTVVQPRPSTVASPRAKRVAREHNLDWTQLAGSGSKGQVRQRDVQAALAQHSSEPNFQAERMILSNRRRVIAQRMVASRQNMIPVTLFSKANADNLVNLREQFKSVSDAALVPSYQDFITKLVGNALAKHRLLAGRLEEDAIVLPPDHEIHIGMAVDTSDGGVTKYCWAYDHGNCKAVARCSRTCPSRKTHSRRNAGRRIHNHKSRRLWRGWFHANNQCSRSIHPRTRCNSSRTDSAGRWADLPDPSDNAESDI